MVNYTRVLALAGRELTIKSEATPRIEIIPDGNARLSDVEDPYDKAGKNVFTFLNYINRALFYILSSKNIEKRSSTFFEELRQSFSMLKLAILQGKIWGKGIKIHIDIDEDLFEQGGNLDEKQALLREVKAVCDLNSKMAIQQGVALGKAVTLRFGANKDSLGENTRVVRTSSDGSHRFSDMVSAKEPFISIASDIEFGRLDETEIERLTVVAQNAQIDVDVTSHSPEEALSIIDNIDTSLLRGKYVHLTIACEEVDGELIDAIRRKVGGRAISVIDGDEIPGGQQLVVQVVKYDPDLIPLQDGVMLGGQLGKKHVVIPACTPEEARFFATSNPKNCGVDLGQVVEKLDEATKLEGGDRDASRAFDGKFREVIDVANALIEKTYFDFVSMGFKFHGKHDDIAPEKIPDQFLLEGKISLPAISSYLTHISFVGQAGNLDTRDIEAMASYVLCTYLIDQIFDSNHLRQEHRHSIRDFFLSNSTLPTDTPGYQSIHKVKEIIDAQRATTTADSHVIGAAFSDGLNELIRIMSEERDEEYDDLDAYLTRNSASFGAGLVMMKLEARLQEAEQLEPSTRSELYALVDQLARLLNDLQTHERETDKKNAVSILIEAGKSKPEAIAMIEGKISELKQRIYERIADLNDESTLTKAIKRFLYFGIEIKEYALGIDSAFEGEKALKKIIKQYNEEGYIKVD